MLEIDFSRATKQTASAFLARSSVRLPEISGPAEHQDYLALLDRCLLDRHGCKLLHGIDPSICIATLPSTHPGSAENRKIRRRSRARPGVDTSMAGQAGQAFYFSPVGGDQCRGALIRQNLPK
ncbi:hypothetical protein [Cryobacterium sp. Y82]|uniref:hypothetical protein n=1 Tax=Cryobacterium sp. Y82 TaxID=2045017 RepID=UPI0011B05AF6|nr:hypothetical protein [Cryobacterium sp. Y82]